MTTQTALMSIEQYLRTSYSPDVDYVDGVIEHRNLGEFDHARWQALVGGLIGTNEQMWSVIGVTGNASAYPPVASASPT